MTANEFNVHVHPHAKALLAHALKFTGDLEDAHDLMQDTLMKALRFYDRFEEGTNIKGWLFVIMRNTFINEYRRRAKKQSMVVQTEEISSDQLMVSSAKNTAEGSFAMGDIRKALNRLSEAYRVPFVRYVEGYKYEEIAQELSIPLGTVKTRIHQARVALKKHLVMYQEDK
ncbi:RNA polymerase sigma factor [Pedobacter aquatilis]|uniref:RNA polymerase sigma factor n=1 Tax=Pedobacter aquatilis TaxID=351343 RepID=UPI0025B37904|nr:RNA polymerase sigma factor [Pedobacter aquatilis]MDN3585985.1 RNA polymerase sigma factor [Pedobacter aquatilis]